MRYRTFEMERWQSTWEHRVPHNLSESGVHPLSVSELLEMAGEEPPDPRLGYVQTDGTEELRTRAAQLHPGAGPSSVLVTSGGAEANFVSTWMLLEEGRPLAALLPSYMQVPRLVESLGGRVIPVPLLESEGWQPDLDALDGALEAGAGSVLVTHPNNPTGASLTPGSVDAVSALARRHGAWILADEVYRGAEREGGETPSFHGRGERILVTNSLSKAYGLPGLRVGWVVGPEETVADLWGRKDFSTISVSTFSDRLARLALRPRVREAILARTRRIVRENFEVVEEWLAPRSGRLALHPPDAGAICWIRLEDGSDDTELAERLRERAGVLVVPGAHFGRPGYIRIGFGVPRPELHEALERMGPVLDDG